MTKKQFKAVRIDDEISYIVIDGIQCYIDTGDDEIIESKLNELSEEIMQLKQQLKIYRDGLKSEIRETLEVTKDYDACLEEKEHLKQSNQKAIDIIEDAIVEIHDGKRDYAETLFNKTIKLLKGDDVND